MKSLLCFALVLSISFPPSRPLRAVEPSAASTPGASSEPPAANTPADPPSPFAAPAEQLAQLVRTFVDRDEIVGAELLVVHNRRPVLHRAFGYADREAKRPMAVDAFFAVRSMTKPFTGMAAQILIDEGKIEPDAPVAKYLPSFANEKSRAITVRQLLTHRGGFSFVMPMSKPLSAFAGGLRELADLAGERGPAHAPGSRYEYSDVGSDALGAVVSAASGQSLETFIARRILEPLQLADTFPETEAVTAGRRERVPARYLGIAGHWTRYWSAADAPIYPFLKGSGGLFSTARDYARFLQVWMDRERGGGRALLSADAFARALTPTTAREAANTGFPGAEAGYGQMWMLYRDGGSEARDGERPFAFGHGGSDGTHAYAFPKENLIVCYLTQTRGNHTPGRFEAALSHLFLKPDAAAFARLTAPGPMPASESAEFTGLYAKDNRVGSLAAIVEVAGELMFEVPGRMVLKLRPTEERDRWVPESMPNDSVVFRREDGRVAGLAVSRNGKVDEAVRFRPDAALPTVDELLALRARAAPPGAWAGLLPLRIESTMELNGARHPVVEIHDADGRSLTEVDFGAAGKMSVWSDGARVWRRMPGQAATELRGLERSEAINDSPRVALGDWRSAFREVVVLGREKFQGREVFRARTVPREGLASTKLVSADDGAVLAEFWLALVPGAGLQAMERRHGDFREIAGGEGPRFPFAQTLHFAGAKIPLVVTRIEPRAEIDRAALAAPGGER